MLFRSLNFKVWTSASSRGDLTSGEFKKPFSYFLVRYTFACIELGFSFGDRSGFLVGIDLLEDRCPLGHAALPFGCPMIIEFARNSERSDGSHRFKGGARST